MNLTNYYWYFQSAIPERICDDIVRYGKSLQDQMAVTGGYGNRPLDKNQIKDLKKKRNSDIVWMNDRWIYKEIHPYVYQANRNAGWNFDWVGSEKCQFTIYKESQFYDWHQDSHNKMIDGNIRKLSVTVSLEDGEAYEGGDLEIYTGHEPLVVQKKKGMTAFFPSYQLHGVTPVTKGTRYSLVVWVHGPAFR